MSRLAVLALALVSAAACSKSAGNQEPAPAAGGAPEAKGMQPMTVGGGPGAPGAAAPKGGVDERLRLHADEGTIAVTAPADAKAGAESVATILVTPGTGYHVNTEFPIKLKLDAPTGVTLAKSEWTAGGSSKDKGDADALDEQHLALSIKLTPGATGTYTINGTFKFAVCDHDSCLAKKEPIAITVAAK